MKVRKFSEKRRGRPKRPRAKDIEEILGISVIETGKLTDNLMGL